MKRNTGAKKTVWNFLLDNIGEKYYLTQIARKTNISDATIYQILEQEIKTGLVKKEKLGNLSFYWLDRSNLAVRLKKQARTIAFLKSLAVRLKDISQKIVLYGSAALGTDTKTSDIDLLVISDQKSKVYQVFSQFRGREKIKLVVKNYLEWLDVKHNDRFFYQAVVKGTVLWDKNEAI